MRHVMLLGVGYGFLGLGVVGLFLPFLQGILFIVIGLVILSHHALWARRALVMFRRRYPRAGRVIRDAELRARQWISRIQTRFGS